MILTDIKMNQVTGIDVAQYVFENQLPCKVVFLSGYKEFELAVKGMQYGVEDYLLKPTNVKKLKETFENIKKELDEIHHKQRMDQEEKERLDEMLPLLKEQFFSDLVFGGLAENEKEIRNRMHLLFPEEDPDSTVCVLADVVIRNYDWYINEVWKYSFDQFRINLENFFRVANRNIDFYMIYKSNQVLRLFGFWNTGGEKAGLEQKFREEMDWLMGELKQNFRLEADYELKYLMQNIFQIQKYQEQLVLSQTETGSGKEFLSEQMRLIITNIHLGNFTTAQKILQNILHELRDTYEGYRNHVVIDLFSSMSAALREENPELYEYLRVHCNYSTVLSIGQVDALQDYCDRILEGMRAEAGKKEASQDNDCLINRVQTYIQEHITEDISLEMAASQLYISSSYLSRLFKKQTGENFTQYVTRKKMEKAIELLHDSRYKTYQVGEYLGYKTPRYFARLFRQQTGMNPSEYRNKVLHTGGSFDEI